MNMPMKCVAVLGDHSAWKTETVWQLPGSYLLNYLAGSLQFLVELYVSKQLQKNNKKKKKEEK